MMNTWWWEEEEDYERRSDDFETKLDKLLYAQKIHDAKIEARFKSIESMFRDIRQRILSNAKEKGIECTPSHPRNRITIGENKVETKGLEAIQHRENQLVIEAAPLFAEEHEEEESGIYTKITCEEETISAASETSIAITEDGGDLLEKLDEVNEITVAKYCVDRKSVAFKGETRTFPMEVQMLAMSVEEISRAQVQGEIFSEDEESYKSASEDGRLLPVTAEVGEKNLEEAAPLLRTVGEGDLGVNWAKIRVGLKDMWAWIDRKNWESTIEWAQVNFIMQQNRAGPRVGEYSRIERKFRLHRVHVMLIFQNWADSQLKIAATCVALQSSDLQTGDVDRAPPKPPWTNLLVIAFQFLSRTQTLLEISYTYLEVTNRKVYSGGIIFVVLKFCISKISMKVLDAREIGLWSLNSARIFIIILEGNFMLLREVDHFKKFQYANGITYGKLFLENEKEMRAYYWKHASVDHIHSHFDLIEDEARRLLDLGPAFPAYDKLFKTSHAFNVMDSRAFVGVTERARYFGRMRSLARQCAKQWFKMWESFGHPLGAASSTEHLDFRKETEETNEKASKGPRTFSREIGEEGVPPKDVVNAFSQLKDIVKQLLEQQSLIHGIVLTFGIPCRLVIHVDKLCHKQVANHVEVRGPPATKAFNQQGNPTKAAEGCCRRNGVPLSSLYRRVEGRTEYEENDAQFPDFNLEDKVQVLGGRIVRALTRRVHLRRHLRDGLDSAITEHSQEGNSKGKEGIG